MEQPAAVSDYISDMCIELSILARRNNLGALSYLLRIASLEANQVLVSLEVNTPHAHSSDLIRG